MITSTGRVDLRYNPMSIEEDYFIPVRAGSATDIPDSCRRHRTSTQIDDIKYLRDKLFSALKIPKHILLWEKAQQKIKQHLAQKDIRFARTIQRLQSVMIASLEKIGIIHLYTLGFRGDDLLSFKLALNNPSKIAELQEIEHWKAKFDIAASATEGFFRRRWVAETYFGYVSRRVYGTREKCSMIASTTRHFKQLQKRSEQPVTWAAAV